MIYIHTYLPIRLKTQARTYLFCAVRPEVTYSNYTFATLVSLATTTSLPTFMRLTCLPKHIHHTQGFAKNASVVKLQPKKATVAMSAAEKKLFAELENMKVGMYACTCLAKIEAAKG